MSRMNIGDGGLPSQQPGTGFPQAMMGISGFPPSMPMASSPPNPTGFQFPKQQQQQQQQQQHHERMIQLNAERQNLEMQLKQSQFSNATTLMQKQSQQQQLQKQKQNIRNQLLQRLKSDEISSVGSIAGMSVPNTLDASTEIKKLPLNSVSGSDPLSTNQVAQSTIRRESSAQVPAPIVPTGEMKQLISGLDWTDRTIYVSRLLMGGASINGFLRATATAQRIKKQRARQIKKQQLSPNEEEDLKKEAMNPRTAKKLRSELVAGLEFCKNLHDTLRSIMTELDPSQLVAPLTIPNPVATGVQEATYIPPSTSKPVSSTPAIAPSTKQTMPPPLASAPAAQVNTSTSTSTSTSTASPGDPNGSTLRKLRKRKFPDVAHPNVSEIDPGTNKKYSKKDYALVLLDVIRFRSLKEGDYVAAKPSSHHLWILARVMKDYPFDFGQPAEFLQLSETKRETFFREKVILKDIEDTNSSNISVARSSVLPLPRTFAEAADWGGRCRKGCRVYAMYPMTTALYSGTVIDNTTYCRGDDDIIVVEFDNEEVDSKTGKIPFYHIPARFVTLIPREFPGATQNSKKRKSGTVASLASTHDGSKAAKGNTVGSISVARHKRGQSFDSALNDMLEEIEYNDIGVDLDLAQFDLEFDLRKEHKN